MINIDVAVAVIHYDDQYLLGFRKPEQHQGNSGTIAKNRFQSDAALQSV